MKRILINDEAVSRFVADKVGVPFNLEYDHSIGTVNMIDPFNPKVLGGVLYTSFTGVACSMHMAGLDPSWTTPNFLSIVFDYPFNQLGLERVFGLVRSSNAQARFIDGRLGFREVATIPRMFAGDDGIVLCLERGDCRWLKRPPRKA